ncbi:MAG: 5-(carboxyamino)imidazole ribonucleotide synthase [Hyphomicrobiales bacterium]|nr:5-(carboxyamino)imidazole ribonucleotide synthase [Hyphomicrobiales bacterium]
MKPIPPGSTIGIVGGGQLGRMTTLAAANLGYKVHIFCANADSPAAQVCSYSVIADIHNHSELERFAREVDVITFENEDIPNDTILFLEKFTVVRPRQQELYITHNRLREKQFLHSLNIPTSAHYHITSSLELTDAHQKLGLHKAILKTTELNDADKKYAVIDDTLPDYHAIWTAFDTPHGILEEYVPFTREFSIIAARDLHTNVAFYPPTEYQTVNERFHHSTAPASIPASITDRANEITRIILDKLHFVGICTVEFFLLENGDLLVNELTPRLHNSGLWTQDGCVTSQFEQLVRAICGLPLGSTVCHTHVETQILFDKDAAAWATILKNPKSKLHLYGKHETWEHRRMGHVNTLTPL